jgi:tetraacyldisaccharide 4'-kinase
MDALTLALAPLGGLYGAAMKARRALYRAGRLPIYELGVPVISVGNLTTGGTGKTPLVEWIAGELSRSGRRVCILTRGYGRRSPRARVIVSNGSEVLADATHAGDEPLLLAERLRGLAAVICDPDRVSAGLWAIRNFHSEVLVLDDGFQHLRVARNLNILTIDATNPWGNGKILPAGILREPRAEVKRADCIVVTRADQPNSTAELLREIREQNSDSKIFSSRMKLIGLRPIQSAGEQTFIPDEEIKASNVTAFCGVGNPESFFSMLRREGYQLKHTQVFRDHQPYAQRDINRIVRESLGSDAKILLTTAKDEVKLRSLKFELPCYAVHIALAIENEDGFRALITAAADHV